MKNLKPETSGNSRNGSNLKNQSNGSSKQKETGTENTVQQSQLNKLFEDELKDIYWAEKALTKAIPKMIKNSTSDELVTALENHLEETLGHVKRCEQVFDSIEKKATAKKCEAMEGLMKEGEEIMKDTEKGGMRDAGIISAAQKVEHYEIASYGTLRQFAETLGYDEAESLLAATLSEEKAADEKLTEIAVTSVNLEASEVESV